MARHRERDTSEALGNARLEVQKTLTAYNALVTQPSKNMKGDYTKLLKSMDSMNKKVTEATTKLGAMQGAADTYFQGRGKTIKNIQDQALQLQAQQRAAAERGFAGVLWVLLGLELELAADINASVMSPTPRRPRSVHGPTWPRTNEHGEPATESAR